jgi:hypothetical protein
MVAKSDRYSPPYQAGRSLYRPCPAVSVAERKREFAPGPSQTRHEIGWTPSLKRYCQSDRRNGSPYLVPMGKNSRLKRAWLLSGRSCWTRHQIVTKAKHSASLLLRVRNSDLWTRQSPKARIYHNIWWFQGARYPAKCMRTKADIELVSDSDAICSSFVSILNMTSTARRPGFGDPHFRDSLGQGIRSDAP